MIGDTAVVDSTRYRQDRLDWGALALVLVVSIVVKAMALDPVGPAIFFDELLYKQGADALAEGSGYPSAHYPFLYPMLLSPAIAIGAGYQGIFIINFLTTTALVPLCWLLARTCGARWGWPSAAIAAALPIQFTFPTQVMSENLFVPLFTACIWYAVRSKPVRWFSAFWFGIMLGGTFLTKYLSLPAIPVLLAVWLFGLHQRHIDRADFVRHAGWACFGLVLSVSAWVIYAGMNGIAPSAALGANVYDNAVIEGPVTFDSVVFWTVAYLSVCMLVVGPFAYAFLDAGLQLIRAPIQLLRASPFHRLILVCVLFIGGYALVCISHSAQLAMNYPDPQRVVVRYFMQLVPAIFVAGMVRTMADGREGRLGLLPGFVASTLLVALIVLSHRVLYEDLIWDLPPWFAAIPLYSADILGYQEGIGYPMLLALVLLAPLAAVNAWWRWILAISAIVLISLASLYVNEHSERETKARPVHAKELLHLVTPDLDAGKRVLVVWDIPRIPSSELKQAFAFWGVDPEAAIDVVGSQQVVGFSKKVDSIYWIGNRMGDKGLVPLRTYPYGRRGVGYIYRVSSLPGVGGGELADDRATFVARPGGVCEGIMNAVVELAWAVPADVAREVSVMVQTEGEAEKLFAISGGSGGQSTGPWVRPDTRFVLRNTSTGKFLTDLRIQAIDCRGRKVPQN